MPFDAFEISLSLVSSLRPLIDRIKLHDPDLASQLRRAASSVSLNLCEGRRRAGRDRLHHWRIAAGSADEVRASLRVAAAWAYLDSKMLCEPLTLVDRVLAMLWRMTHSRG